MNLKILAFLFFAILLQACATVSRGSTDFLRVDSVPQGATVITTIETKESKERGLYKPLAKKSYRSCAPTPCFLEVGRAKVFAIRIEHEGYEPAEIAIHGDIPSPSANIDMAIPVQSAATNVALGAGNGFAFGAMTAETASIIVQGVTMGTGSFNSSAFIAGATTAGLGIGVAMVGVDLMTGSYENIYPNPIVVKLAPKGTPSKVDPNMAMFRLRQAKKRLVNQYCDVNSYLSARREREICDQAKALDKKRDQENAFILEHEDEIRAATKTLKAEVLKARAKARAARRKSPRQKSK